MHRPIRVCFALVAWVLSSVAPAQDPSIFSYSILTEDQAVGEFSLTQRTDGSRIILETRLAISENGRGPQFRETIELNGQQELSAWRIEGRSTFGALIDERYAYKHPKATWSSGSEQGKHIAQTAPVYVPANASDWLYPYLITQSKRASQADGLDVLPAGRVRIEWVDTIDGLPCVAGARVYMLTGLELEPVFVVLDDDDHLVARLGTRQWVLRSDLKAHAQTFIDSFHRLTTEHLSSVAADLTHSPAGRVVYDRVHVIDVEEGRASPLTRVAVVDGQIEAIHRELPVDETVTVIDGQGGYLVPGLFDLHVHSSPWTGLYHLAAGVTSVRDQGTPVEVMDRLLAQGASGQWLGPTIYPSGLVEGLSPYSTRSGKVVDGLPQALAAIDAYHARGYRQIKLYNSIRPEWVVLMIEHAHLLDMKVTGHVPAFMSADEAIEAGYDDISHLNQLMLGWVLQAGEDTRTPLRITAMTRASDIAIDQPSVQHTLDAMVEHQVALDTTAMILERVFLSRSGQVNVADQPYLDHMPMAYQRFRRRAILSIDSQAIDQAYQAAFEKILKVMSAVHDRGIQLLPGTDDGTGFSLHRELELYVQAGLSPAESLALVTIRAAEYLGVSEVVGTIEPGKRADFILVEDNPLDNISATRGVRWISQGHRMFAPQAIHRALGVKPFGTPPPVRRSVLNAPRHP